MPRLTVMPWDLSGRRAHAMEVIAHEEKMTNAHAERHAAQRVITLELEQARLLRCHIAGRSGDSGAPSDAVRVSLVACAAVQLANPKTRNHFLRPAAPAMGTRITARWPKRTTATTRRRRPCPPCSRFHTEILHLCASRSAGCVPGAHNPRARDRSRARSAAPRSQTQYAPGEGVLVTFDFSGAERLCRLLTVSLHTRERYRGHALGGSSAESLGDGGGEIAHETLVTSCQRDIDLSNPEEQREKVSAHGKRRGRESTGIAPHTCSFVRSRSRACFGSRPRRHYRSRRAS